MRWSPQIRGWYFFFILTVGIIVSACQHSGNPGALSRDVISDSSLDSLYKHIQSIQYSDGSLALTLALEGFDQARENLDKSLQIRYAGILGDIFQEEGIYDEAHLYYDLAIQMAAEIRDTLLQVDLLGKKGFAYLYTDQDSGAMRALSTALLMSLQAQYPDETQQFSHQIPAYIDLAQLYSSLLDFDQADEQLTLGKKLLDEYPDTMLLARWHEAVAFRSLNEGMFEDNPDALITAIEKYRESNRLYQNKAEWAFVSPNVLNIVYAFEHLASLQDDLSMLDSAQRSLDQFSNLRESDSGIQYELSAMHARAGLQTQLKQYPEAEATMKEILVAASQSGTSTDSALVYWGLADMYNETGQSDSALAYLYEYESLAAEIRNQRSDKALQFAEARFQTEKKDLENLQVRMEARERLGKVIGIAGLAGLILLSIVIYLRQRQKHQKIRMGQQAEINRQTIVDLLKEQSIENLNARLEGQERERTRIARELHDHLGGTLAAAKLSLEGLKSSLLDNAQTNYEQTTLLLQNAYLETRHLSHEMMALPLKDLGLEASLRSLCATINGSEKLTATFHSHLPGTVQIDSKLELHLYRITQELLQNVVKHAHATMVTVQLTSDLEEGTLIVEDNGKGFPEQKLAKGMGLSNIQHRVEHLSGTIDIDSIPQKGSTVIIQFPLSS